MDTSTSRETKLNDNKLLRDEGLNHVAGRVAAGQVDFNIDCQFQFIQVDAKGKMQSFAIPHNCRLSKKNGTNPILVRLQRQIDSSRIAAYLQERDGHREALTIPRLPRWTNMTPALAAQVYNVHVHKSLLLNASHSVKLI